MGSCFKFGKRKNTYRFTDPYSKSTPDGKYQLQDNTDLSSTNYVVPAGLPTTNTEVSEKNELRTSTEENGVSPAVTNTTTEITTTTVTKRTTYTKSDDADGDGPRVNGDIAGDVAATAATAVVVAGAVDAVKPTEDEEDGKQEEDTVAVMRETEDGEPERAENIYTYETSVEDSSSKLEEEPQAAEDEYEAISDAVTFSETQAYQAEAYEVAVTSSTVAVGQEDGVVEVSDSDAYYTTPAEEDYYSTVAEPEDDAAVIVTTQSVVYENPPIAFDDEQQSHTAVSDELSQEAETAGLEDGVEDPTYSMVEKTTVITTSSTGEDSTANTTSRLSTDYEEGQGGCTTTTVTTTETTYYSTEPSYNNDSTEQQSADWQEESQRTSVTVNYTTDGNDLHQQLTTTNSLESQTPTSGQFARNVDDYVLS